jgi:O-antigen/teichoic acid export membrane protein
MGMLAMLAVPAAAGIFAVAPFLVPVVLGVKWLAAVPLMEILALNGALLLFHSSICTVLIANGHPDRVTKTNGLYVAMMLAFFGLLIPVFGITGVAYAALSASILSTPIYLRQVRQGIGVPPSVFLRAAARPVAAALVMVGMVRWVMPVWSASMGAAESLVLLMGGILFGIVTYAVAVLLLWIGIGRPDGAEWLLLDALRQRLAKKRTALAIQP